MMEARDSHVFVPLKHTSEKGTQIFQAMGDMTQAQLSHVTPPWNLKHVAPESRDGSHSIHGTAMFTYIWVIFMDECRCISKYIYININEIIYHTWILWGWKTIIAFPFCVNRPIFKGDFREKSPGGTRQRLSAEFFPGFHAQHWQKHLQVHNWQFHLREGFICVGGRI